MAESNTNNQEPSNDEGNDARPLPSFGDTRIGDNDPAVASSDVGTLLCVTRMRAGKDLQLVAKVLCIQYRYIVAIEDGRYEDLPGQAYAIGFIRAYADYLGLDGNEVVRRYKEGRGGVKLPASIELPIPTSDTDIPSGTLLALAVVFGMVVYGAWYSIAGLDRSSVRLVQEIPSRLAVLINDGARLDFSAVSLIQGVYSGLTALLNDGKMQFTSGKEREVEVREAQVAAALPPTLSEKTVPPPRANAERPDKVAPERTAEAAGRPQPPVPVATAPTESARRTDAHVASRSDDTAPARDNSPGDGVEVQVATASAKPRQPANADESEIMDVVEAGGLEVLVNGILVPSLGTVVGDVDFDAELTASGG